MIAILVVIALALAVAAVVTAPLFRKDAAFLIQELGRRGGTENVPGIVGFGVAAGVGVGVRVGVGAGVGVGVGAGVGVGVGVDVGEGAETWIDTVASADETMPSETLYVNVRVPVNEPPDVNVNPPFEEKASDPLPLLLPMLAVSASPSASESLDMTPGADTVSLTPVVALYESLNATGAAFVTVIVTKAVDDSRPSRVLARYVNVSVPTKFRAGV